VPDDSFDPSLALVGRFVELRPLERRHAPELIRWLRDGTVLQFFRAPPGTTDRGISAWIDATIEGGRSGTNRPLTTVLRSTGTPVGMTQFLRIDRPNRGVEIGSTWVAPPFWRTPVNTEAKLLMLRHAFDHAHFHRVQIQTDLRNARSQRAIEGLGSVAEARLREDVALPDGSYRTSVYYSILEDEWRAVRTHLETRLDRPWNPPTEPPPLSADADGGGRPDGTPSPPSAPLQFRPPFTLTGPHVRLVPLVRADLPELTAAGSAPEIWPLLRIQHGDTPEGMAALVDDLLTLQAAGEVIPFTVRWGREGRIVGVARYLDIDRANRWVELGTWLHPSVWRTPVNTELKLLLLRHAFDVEKVHRVQLKTDDRNGRSIRAIERLGAVYEGERRDHYRFPDGRYRTSKYFSILEGEWPTVREHLQAFLKRPWPDLANTP
jgi:RimJ/RimL family protein N-acetyltransferase